MAFRDNVVQNDSPQPFGLRDTDFFCQIKDLGKNRGRDYK
jgi:hypothetical protein